MTFETITRLYSGPADPLGGIIGPMTRGRPRTTPLSEPKNRIREWREKRHLSLKQLSKLTQPRVPAATIQRHETGAGVDTRYLEIYARALDVRTEELLPQGNTLSEQDRALLGLFHQLDPANRQRLIRLGHSLVEPPPEGAEANPQ